MVFRVFEAEYGDLSFKIEEDFPEVGAYLFVYKNGICISDFLQNNVDICKLQAEEIYGVKVNFWTEST